MGSIGSDSTHFPQQQRVISAPSSYPVSQPWQSVASRQPVVDPNYLVQTPTYSFSTPQMMPQISNNAFGPNLPFFTYPQQSYMPGVPIHGSASSSTQSPLIYVSQQPTVNPVISSDLTIPIAQRENIGLGVPTPVNSRDSQVTVQSAYHFPSVPTLSPLDISPTTYPQTDPTIFPNTIAGLPQTSVSPEANDKSSASAPASTSGPSRLAILSDLPDNVTYRRTSSSEPKAEGFDPVDSISDRLGEFLFSEGESPATTENVSSKEESEWQKKRRTGKGQTAQWVSGGKTLEEAPDRTSLLLNRAEFDGLKDEHRNLLLDCFLAHVRLFFAMSIPRFRYRLTFTDKRRPSPALLNAMYLWATRLSQAPNSVSMEDRFFREAYRHLDAAAANNDRLIDAIRAAMLLSAYTYTNNRHHEGWLVAGIAVRLVLSTGIHRIPSLTFRPAPPKNRLLRNRSYLLPPPEDSIELAERVHAFWCVYSVERCGALATGFPSSISDDDILTPFGLPLDDISSQNVTSADDITIRDLYRNGHVSASEHDSWYVRWIKAVTILERASKLAFLEAEDDSDYSRAWAEYLSVLGTPDAQSTSPPPLYLNQPKYRNPRGYRDCLFALNKLKENLGADGMSILEKKKLADVEGAELVFGTKQILLHHHFFATDMLLHDINSENADNSVAMQAARQSVDLFRYFPQLPSYEVDAEVILVWCMVAKCLIKELDRFSQLGDVISCKTVSDDVDIIINELYRIGEVMPMSRTQAKAMEEMKKMALASQYV
ncbi:hypothetical protein I307_03231 [Cryptococcus deuterogattii 99/473]|uniref:Xylanolytic transcriptional activator regulatory domain-containing protein n=1 Tax=Cryptococcus deuterogattii Ram5 TaxID=1296110 RepID=A0A0D0T5B6_9TREE|nr:hypothetical protein I313_03017 [Cryptococcus deuterogattii Ram5]KIR72422.1 hypothetical protein I310_03828 [Cryptococcus deuterogattii CA1014]KIY57311.1 hypothetical protein I307_03231 [Cryptococcus deuterogattii 99/473]